MLIVLSYFCFFFFFKQKTAYEMRISDWSSDVCSSDLIIWSAATSAARCTSPPACAGAASRYRCCILWRCWRNSGRVVSERRIDPQHQEFGELALDEFAQALFLRDRKSTRLNSSH